MTDMLLFSQFHPPCILLRMYNQGNTMGTNSGEGTVHPIETPKFIPLTVLRCVCVTKSLVIRITPLAFFFLLLYRNPGRFTPITCSPRKVSRFASLNRYYIIIDEVFFDNFLVIIYLLVVCKKNIIHSFWSTFVKDLKRNLSCKIYKKQHENSKKVGFFCTNAKMH